MNYTTYIAGALDFSIKYEASHVTIETDEGIFDMSPREAEQQFDQLNPGESFTLLAIHFSTDN